MGYISQYSTTTTTYLFLFYVYSMEHVAAVALNCFCCNFPIKIRTSHGQMTINCDAKREAKRIWPYGGILERAAAQQPRSLSMWKFHLLNIYESTYISNRSEFMRQATSPSERYASQSRGSCATHMKFMLFNKVRDSSSSSSSSPFFFFFYEGTTSCWAFGCCCNDFHHTLAPVCFFSSIYILPQKILIRYV